jgi:hypothetical protein
MFDNRRFAWLTKRGWSYRTAVPHVKLLDGCEIVTVMIVAVAWLVQTACVVMVTQ